MDARQATARFYFELTYLLAKEDITKISDVEKQKLYLCLNVAAVIKDKAVKHNDEIRKIKMENDKLLNSYK